MAVRFSGPLASAESTLWHSGTTWGLSFLRALRRSGSRTCPDWPQSAAVHMPVSRGVVEIGKLSGQRCKSLRQVSRFIQCAARRLHRPTSRNGIVATVGERRVADRFVDSPRCGKSLSMSVVSFACTMACGTSQLQRFVVATCDPTSRDGSPPERFDGNGCRSSASCRMPSSLPETKVFACVACETTITRTLRAQC